MKIRSVTCFYHPAASPAGTMERLGRLVEDAITRFTTAGYEVQTTRLSSVPFPRLLPEDRLNDIVRLAQDLEDQADEHGFAYLSLGPALPEIPASYELIPELLASTRNVFLSGVMAAGGVVSQAAAHACGRIIEKAASITPDGFTNLRFAALANVLPFGPFFPGSFSDGGGIAFALAMECADAAVEAFRGASTVDEGRRKLLDTLNSAAQELSRLAADLSKLYDARFAGFDFSLAPFPEDRCSLGCAMERMGVQQVGLSGSLSAAAILADTLDQGGWPRAGFNGMMMPVLEDSVLAARSGDTLSVKDLLLYSAVCGTGLDTVPLPGDATAAQLSALLLDVASLSTRLGKPLTARLMPVPGKQAGEMTEFDFGFFQNGRIMSLPAVPLSGSLGNDGSFILTPRTH